MGSTEMVREFDNDNGAIGLHGGPGSRVAAELRVNDFAIQQTPVTIAEFRAFVRDTKYKSEAEKWKWSFVFDMLLPTEVRDENERVGVHTSQTPRRCVMQTHAAAFV